MITGGSLCYGLILHEAKRRDWSRDVTSRTQECSPPWWLLCLLLSHPECLRSSQLTIYRESCMKLYEFAKVGNWYDKLAGLPAGSWLVIGNVAYVATCTCWSRLNPPNDPAGWCCHRLGFQARTLPRLYLLLLFMVGTALTLHWLNWQSLQLSTITCHLVAKHSSDIHRLLQVCTEAGFLLQLLIAFVSNAVVVPSQTYVLGVFLW